MKKLIQIFAFMLATASAFAQGSDPKAILQVRDHIPQPAAAADSNLLPKGVCSCPNNILKDGSFATVTTNPGNSNISSGSPVWKPGTQSPQWYLQGGCCDNGFLSMWGNKTVGESVRQTGITFIPGKTYRIQFCARFGNNTGPSNPFVRFRFKLLPANIIISPSNLNITSTSWGTYSFNWTATTSGTGIDIGPENDNVQNDGKYVSWGQLDNVCIQEICNCDVFTTKPPINGPAALKCDTAATFSTANCPGASIIWAVSPAVSFAGQGTSSITLNPPFSAPAYTISVTIRCGGKSVTNSIVRKVAKPECCSPAFMISTQEVSATLYRITGIPSVSTLGCRHYWLLSQISNCSGSGAFGASGWGLSYNAWGYVLPQSNPNITTAGPNYNGYTYPGLGKGQCYTLTHYVLCCGEWKYVRKCFCMNNQAKMAAGAAAAGLNSNEQSGTIEYKDLPQVVKDMHDKAQ